MFSLHKRRLRGDLIEVFKILNQFDKISPDKLFEMNNATVTRGNGMNLKDRDTTRFLANHTSLSELLTTAIGSQLQ